MFKKIVYEQINFLYLNSLTNMWMAETEFKSSKFDDHVSFYHLWRHLPRADCCGKYFPGRSPPRVFLFLSGSQIAPSRCILVACIPRLPWRILLSGFSESFLISRDYFWSVNCTMGCFLWLCWGRFVSSRHSTIGHRWGMCWSEFLPSPLWTT